jgi:CheY-specific phosphatase CheX
MENSTVQRSYETEVNDTVSDLFGTMLGTEATPSEEKALPGKDLVTAIIAFAGAWNGDLVLDCCRAQALVFAQRFLQCEELSEVGEEVISTIAELSNIVAGNLKVVLPSGTNISTPSVIEGGNYEVRVYRGKILNHTIFSTDAGPFSVRLIEASSTNKGAQR